MTDNKYKPVEAVINLDERKEDLQKSLIGIVKESSKKINTKNMDDTDISKRRYQIDAGTQYAQVLKESENHQKCEKELYNLLQIISLNKLDEIVNASKSVNKILKHIKKIGVNDIFALLTNINTFISRYKSGHYKLKNNLIDFDQDNYFSEREYINSTEVLLEIMLYDIYSYIVNPVAKAFTNFDFAIDIFDPIIKFLHFRFGEDAVNYRNKDDVYDLYGIDGNEYVEKREKEANEPRRYRGKNKGYTSVTSLVPDVSPTLKLLRENVYGVSGMDIESKRIYDEIFSLAEKNGNFIANVNLINDIYRENPSEDIWTIANYVVSSVKKKEYEINSKGYKIYKKDLKLLKDRYLKDEGEDESVYIRELFYEYYNINTVEKKLSSMDLLEALISYNDSLKDEYSLDFRINKMMTLFNNYSLLELQKRLFVDTQTVKGDNQLESDKLKKIVTLYSEAFEEDIGDEFKEESTRILNHVFDMYSKRGNGSTSMIDYRNHQEFKNQVNTELNGFLNKGYAKPDDVVYIIKSIAEDYENGLSKDQLLNRLEATQSILANYSYNGPLENHTQKNIKEMYDFTVEYEDTISERYEQTKNERYAFVEGSLLPIKVQDASYSELMLKEFNSVEKLMESTNFPTHSNQFYVPIEDKKYLPQNELSSLIKIQSMDINGLENLEPGFINKEIAKKIVFNLNKQKLSE